MLNKVDNIAGNKIIIVGVSASGKSTFARKLAQKTELPLTLADEIMWEPGWNYVGDEKTSEKLREIGERDQWIIEGYITKKSRIFLFDKADTIIYLDYSPLVCSLRYVMRWWKYRKNPRPELPGSPEKFSFKFLKLVWTKGEAISLDKYLAEVSDQSKILQFKSPRQTMDLLK